MTDSSNDEPRHIPFASIGNSGHSHTARDVEEILRHAWGRPPEIEVVDEHPNAAVVRRFYDAFAGRDFLALRELFAEDGVWHIPGRSPLSGDYRGVEAVVEEFLNGVVERSEGTLQAEPLDVLASDRHVIVLQRSTGKRVGKTLDLTVCQVFRVEGGKIVEVTPHYSDLYALDAFWSEAGTGDKP